jgi:Xaa-Pro dipeptidase
MILGEAFHRRVLQKVVEHLAGTERDAALILDHTNIRYLTGLDLARTDRPAGACIWKTGEIALMVPHIEAEHAASSWIRDIRWYAEFPADEHPVRWMAREAGDSLVIDNTDALTYCEVSRERPDVEVGAVIEDLRACKTSTEIDLIKRAAGFADHALERAFARLTAGVTERELAADVCHRIESDMVESLGAQYDDARPTIEGRVVGGTHAAWPETPTGGRPLNRGDIVIMEFTVSIGGYHAVAGSTFFLGDPLRDIVSTVNSCMKAQETLRKALRRGTTAGSIAEEVRRTLERAGLGNALRHRPGQGIGLERFEAPWLVQGSRKKIEAGMVVVNQPGIYLTGRTGIRHSETLLVESNGARTLNPGIRRWDDPEERLKEF